MSQHGTQHEQTLIKVLNRIESSLNRIEAKIERFEQFVLEVSPDEAKEDIERLENELEKAS